MLVLCWAGDLHMQDMHARTCMLRQAIPLLHGKSMCTSAHAEFKVHLHSSSNISCSGGSKSCLQVVRAGLSLC